MPQWQHQKFRKANCTGIEILTRQGERGSEMVISEMLLPLHCVINKSVNLPAQDVQERQNTESRCLPWASAHLGFYCIHGLSPVPKHTPHASQESDEVSLCSSIVSCTQMETQLGIWGWDRARCSCTVGSPESRRCLQLDSIQVAATG